MDLLERIVHETDRRFDRVHDRFDKIEHKLDTVLKFKWQIIGGATALSTVIGLALQFYFKIKGVW